MSPKELHTLLPRIIQKGSPQHDAVDSLANALTQDGVRNIAITGAYGSGKSSVISTLIEECKTSDNRCKKERAKNYIKVGNKVQLKWCRISLATIEALNDVNHEDCKEDTTNTKHPLQDKKDEDNFNKRIEYSLLQQLLYKESQRDLPKSRFKKIPFISKEDSVRYAIWTVTFILCWLIAFEPKAFRVDSLYSFFENNFGFLNFVADILASLFLILSSCYIVYQVIRRFTGLSIKKISVPNADIDIDGEKSVFNNYLEEIIYFFQESRYNVVFIEDLDRFNSTHLFLKLRELNNLLNSSHMLKGDIRFVYAIKDDMFVDSGRTKFFDEIIPVIPIINPSNAANKLKEKLSAFNLADKISIDDLKDMAYFIKDMRLLTNIANEYHSYYDMLEVEKNHLNPTKLMGMMIYKNLYPRDFGHLPNRDGILYKLLSKGTKQDLLVFVKEKVIKEKKDKLQKIKAAKEETQQQNLVELRKLYLFEILRSCNLNNLQLYIGNALYDVDAIANNKDLFSVVQRAQSLDYTHTDRYSRSSNAVVRYSFSEIENKVDPNYTYKEREAALSFNSRELDKELHALQIEEQKLNSINMSAMLSLYPELLNAEIFKNLRVPYMIEFFVKRGYLDENYYDYISYFYKGITSDNDHDTLMRIKAKSAVSFDQDIDNVKGLLKEIPQNLFSTDFCLINQIYDYVLEHKTHYNNERELLLNHLVSSTQAVPFLSQYIHKGNCVDEVFNYFVNNNQELSWKDFQQKAKPSDKDLISEWLKVADFSMPKVLEAEKWLEKHYRFVLDNFDFWGQDRTFAIADETSFEYLEADDSPLLDYVCDHQLYNYNRHNLAVLANRYNNKETVTEDNINLTRILNTNNTKLINAVKEDFTTVNIFTMFSPKAKDEDETSLLFIINNKEMSTGEKENIIHQQINKIHSLDAIEKVEDRELAIKENIVEPTWKNVAIYVKTVSEKTDNMVLAKFIDINEETLCVANSAHEFNENDSLFEIVVNSELLSSSNHYSSILRAFTGCTIEKISQGLTQNQLISLLKMGFIPYSADHTNQLKEIGGNAYNKYLLQCWEKHFEDIKGEDLTIDSVLFLLDNKSLLYKDIFLKKIPAIMMLDKSVATAVARVLSANYIFIDYPTINTIIKNSTDELSNLKVAIHTINYDLSPGDVEDVIINILRSLGNEYASLINDGKNPMFPENSQNCELFELLRKNGIISSYKKDKSGIRVYPKHKRQD